MARARADVLRAEAEARLATEQERRGWVRTLLVAWQADRNRGGGLLAGGQFLNATIAGVDPGSLGSDAWNPSVDSGA